MTSLSVSFIVVGENHTNLKVKYGTVTELTHTLWTYIFYTKIVSFKQFNVVELSKLLFRAFINTKLPKLPKENYNYIF